MNRIDSYIILLIVSLLLLSSFLFYSKINEDVHTLGRNLRNNQHEIFSLTQLKIETYLNNLQDKVSIVSLQKAKDLRIIVNSDDEYELLEEIQEEINSKLSNVNKSTIADIKGHAILPDFEGYVGEACKNNLIDFANNDENPIRIHPNNNQFHFDIMTHYKDPSSSFRGIFFTSFKTDAIREILKQGEDGSAQLYLIHNDYPGLIEISSEGHRKQLTRETRLSEKELASAVIQEKILNTSWTLVLLPVSDYLDAKKSQIKFDGAINALLLYLISGVFLVYIFKAKKQGEERIQQYIISLKDANKQVEMLSLTDPLTNIPNRRSFNDRIKVEWSRAKRTSEHVSLLIIDIDYFKQFNDC